MTVSFDQRWEMIHSERAWGMTPNEHVVRFVRQCYADIGGLRLLDLGCGVGAQSFYLASRGFHVTGIDGSPSAIQRCQAVGADAFLSRFQVADVTALPFTDSSFEGAVDVCCLQHVLDPHHITALEEIRRVLRPGALFFSVAAKWDHSTHIADTPLRAMTRNAITDLYNAASGFELLSVDQSAYSINDGAAWISHWLLTARRTE